MMRKLFISSLVFTILVVAMAGCSVNIYGRRKSDVARIDELSSEIAEMEDIKAQLEQKLKGEIAKKKVKLELEKRGLVITFIDKILFDSGKADIKQEGLAALDKVLGILRKKAGDRDIGIEGHTDNVPITYSGWKSNWELSTARATSVLHYLLDEGKIEPGRLSATGYGEHRPVASNATGEGRRRNRRVEIILRPREFEKIDYREEAIK